VSKQKSEVLAVAIGGIGVVFAIMLAIFELLHEHLGIWIVPLLGVLVWREYVFTGMRMELSKLRELTRSAA